MYFIYLPDRSCRSSRSPTCSTVQYSIVQCSTVPPAGHAARVEGLGGGGVHGGAVAGAGVPRPQLTRAQRGAAPRTLAPAAHLVSTR